MRQSSWVRYGLFVAASAAVLLILMACSRRTNLAISPTLEEEGCSCGVEKTVSREVLVFEDADADGQYDSHESPLSDVRVISHSNIHGVNDRIATPTDAHGRATMEVTFTHYFNVYVAPPCGYVPTTPALQDAADVERLLFGFAPDQPRHGEAIVRFFVWHDQDQDGEQDPGEQPLTDARVQIGLLEDAALDRGANGLPQTGSRDDLSATTDGDGWGSLPLGDSCAVLHVWREDVITGLDPYSYCWWQIVSVSSDVPVAVEEIRRGTYSVEYDPGTYYSIEYDLGETVIEIGVIPAKQEDE